ncbi:MAG: hypothetical protein ACI9ES_003445 [Oceanospirillaceae bacterium]|jgi:hypothetical protein
MKKITSLLLIFCTQFVLLANFAVAIDYAPAKPPAQIDFIVINIANQTACIDLINPIASSDIYNTDTTSTSEDADLCLPMGIVTNTCCYNNPIPIFNDHSTFSAITWLPPRSIRPPVSY